ncbi:MAG: hypothetical protein ABI183_25265 [Polyangiaceae bacterium]
MSEQDPPRLSDLGDGDNDFLRDAIEESKRDLPDETRLAAIALKLGPGILGGAAAAGGGGGGVAAGGAGAAKASAAPIAAKITAMSAGMKLATAIGVTVMIGGGAIVGQKIATSSTSAVTVAPTTTAMTSSAVGSVSAFNFALPPASASAAPTPFPSMKPLVIPPRNPDEETKALEQAQDALKTDPEYALSQCDDDAKFFPNGMLVQEREVIAIDALTRLGRMPEAKARAKKFATDYPDSAQLPRVQKLIGKN